LDENKRNGIDRTRNSNRFSISDDYDWSPSQGKCFGDFRASVSVFWRLDADHVPDESWQGTSLSQMNLTHPV
jgi:hypothetical protein